MYSPPIVEAPRVETFNAAFSEFRAGRAQGILVLRTAFLFTHQKTVAGLALKHRLPAISDIPALATNGGLMSYGYDGREAFRLVAETIDQIFRGAKASETPSDSSTFGSASTSKLPRPWPYDSAVAPPAGDQ